MIPASPARAPETAKVSSDQLVGIEAAEARGLGRRTDDADFETFDGAPEQHGRGGDDDQRNHSAEMKRPPSIRTGTVATGSNRR